MENDSFMARPASDSDVTSNFGYPDLDRDIPDRTLSVVSDMSHARQVNFGYPNLDWDIPGWIVIVRPTSVAGFGYPRLYSYRSVQLLLPTRSYIWISKFDF